MRERSTEIAEAGESAGEQVARRGRFQRAAAVRRGSDPERTLCESQGELVLANSVENQRNVALKDDTLIKADR